MIYEPRDTWEVDTAHGPGVVLYIEIRGPLMNDLWLVANKADGQLRHYQTCQLKLSPNLTLEIRKRTEGAYAPDFPIPKNLFGRTG
jgi:hypothetical protein